MKGYRHAIRGILKRGVLCFLWLSFISGTTVALAASVSGTVRSNGLPVPDASVSLQGPPNFNFTTGSSGTYAFAGVPAGNYILTISRSGFQTYTTAPEFLIVGTDPVVHNVTLTSLVILNIDQCSVSPAYAAPGSAVTLTYSITNNFGAPVNVLLAGYFSAAGSTSVAFDDEPNDVVRSIPIGTSIQTRPFNVPANAVAGTYDHIFGIWGGNPSFWYEPLFFPLTPQPDTPLTVPVSVSGRILSLGKKVPGATVSLNGPASFSVTTGHNGNYLFPDVPSGNYNLSVARTGFQTYNHPSQISVGATSIVVPDITLTSHITVNLEGSSVSPSVALPGSTVTITFSVNNTSSGNVDVILAGYFSVQGSTTVAFSDNSQSVVRTIPPGTNMIYTKPYTLAENVPPGTYGYVYNLWGGSLSYPYEPQFSTAPQATALTVGRPDLSIGKSHTGTFEVGADKTYTITVSNAAGAGSTVGPITVTDTLPSGLTYVSGTGTGWSCSPSGQVVTCVRTDPLAPGAHSTFSLTVAVGPAAVPNVTNTASVSTTGEIATGDNSASDTATVANAPDLSISKSAAGNFTLGSNGAYTITVSNAGAGPTTGPITVVDTLPAGLTYVSATGTGWSCTAQNQTVTCENPGLLAAGAPAGAITLTVGVGPAALPQVANTATVATTADANAANNSSSVVTSVSNPQSLQFTSNTYTLEEKGATVRIFVSRTGGSAGAASVAFETTNGSASSGSDYTAVSGTLNWADGDAGTRYFDVPVTSDSEHEGNEAFTATLSNATGASLGTPASTTITIVEIEFQPQKADFDGDGKEDILWRHTASGDLHMWLMDGIHIVADEALGVVSDLNWQIQFVSDFNGDGRADIFWRQNATGEIFLWLMDGVNILASQSLGTISDLNWRIQQIADFNADNKSDVLWRHSVTGQLFLWLMDGMSLVGYDSPGHVADLNWQIKSAADFNGDGSSDVLWRHSVTGQLFLWLMDGISIAGYDPLGTVDLNWQMHAARDFNGDGKADILWRHNTSGELFLWLMDGMSTVAEQSLGTVSDPNWRIRFFADFNGDATADILWRHSETGQLFLWLMDGINITGYQSPGSVADLNWQMHVARDFNGDGKADILWRHATSGQLFMWLMDGMSIIGYESPGTVRDLDWRIVQ